MKLTCYIDIDYTWYDTDRLIRRCHEDLLAQGSTLEDIERTHDELRDSGYSFEAHLVLLGHPPDLVAAKAAEYYAWLARGDEYLYPGVAEQAKRLAKRATLNVLTFGNPDHQRAKVRGLESLQGLVRNVHYVWKDRSKGDVLAENRPEKDGAVLFLDDSPPQLLDSLLKAPWVEPVRIMWPQNVKAQAHAGDGMSWKVVPSFEAFVDYIYSL